MNDTNQPTKSDWQTPEFWKELGQNPLVIAATFFCCCAPLGLVLIGIHPKLSRKTKTILIGAAVVGFIILMIIGMVGVAIDNAKFEEANTLWFDDKQEEAVSLYEYLVDGESGGILDDSKLAIVYGHLIDYEASLGNTARATMWIERAEKFDVVPKTRSEEAQVIISERRQKAAEEKAQQAAAEAQEKEPESEPPALTEGEARRKKLQDEARQLSESNAAESAKHSKYKALIVQVERKGRGLWGKDSSVTVEVGHHLLYHMEFYEFHFEGNNLYCKMMARTVSFSAGLLRLHFEYDAFDEDGVLLESFSWYMSTEKAIRGEPFIGHSLSIKPEVTLIKIH